MATGKDLRRLALLLEGTTEAPHFDRAAFKAVRVYVTRSPPTAVSQFQVHARRARIQMHDGAGRVRRHSKCVGQAGLNDGGAVQAEHC